MWRFVEYKPAPQKYILDSQSTQRSRRVHQSIQLEDLYPVDRLVAAFPHLLSVPTLRWQLRHRDSNGLGSSCVRVGKKLLISRSRYETWLATRAGCAA